MSIAYFISSYERRRSVLTRKISLQLRILILVGTIITITMSVIVWFDSHSLEKSVQEIYIGQLDGVTTAINGRYEESHSIEDVQQIFDYIHDKHENVLELTLYGADRILASTNQALIGQPSPPDLIEKLKNQGTIVAQFKDDSGRPLNRLTKQLISDGNVIGGIEMLLDTTGKANLIKQRTMLIVIVGFSIAVLLLISLHLIIRSMLIRPLLKIRQAAISAGEGAPYSPIQTMSSQELSEVAEAFNQMMLTQEMRYNELQQALETIQRAQKQLVESEKMSALGHLVAGVSHEINTPLGIGVTAASYIADETKEFAALYASNAMKRSDLETYLDAMNETTGMILTNLQRASELVKSFKQVAVDASMATKRSFEVAPYIREVLVSLRPQLKKTNLLTEVIGADNIQIYGDPGAVSQIVTNLVMNSIIHAFEPGSEGKLVFEVLTDQARRITIRYSDNGAGMQPEVAEQIFNPFFTTNRSSGGSGLGMHIVYNLVTQSLGGTIRCDSRLGEGTVFTIQIPLDEG